MSLTIPFTGRREKTKDKRRKHRADDRIAELKAAHAAELARLGDEMKLLRDDNVRLLNRQAAADDYFALLIQDRDQVYTAWEFAEQKRQEAETVAVCAMDESRRLADELAWWREKFGQQVADEANANRVDVPPMVRDTTAIEDQATGPIDVRTLRQAADAGLLGPVTDPGHATTH